MKRFSTVKRRLVAWNLLVLGLVLSITLGSAALSEVRATDADVEHHLRLAATRASLGLGFEHEEEDEHGKKDDDHERHERASFDKDPETAGIYVIRARPGEPSQEASGLPLPAGLPDAMALAEALRGDEWWSTVAVPNGTLKVLSVPVKHEGEIVGAVQVALPVGERRAVLGRSLFILLATGAAGLLLSALGSFFLAARAMRPIEEAFERQRRFLADASHELRTPVAVVRARAELLQKETSGLAEEPRTELVRLHRDASELSTLLEDLLDLARLEGGEEPLALDPVALVDVAEEMAAQLAPIAEAREISLVARAEPLWARTNLGRFRQVLRALVDNALKHARKGGRVTISVEKSGVMAKVVVEDDGEGIAAEHVPRVFDRFYRVDEGRSRDEKGAAGSGAGLGLAIAAELVRRMQGEIRLESELGRGTRVTVLLPLA